MTVTSVNQTIIFPGPQWYITRVEKRGSFISLIYEAEHATLEVIYNDQGREVFCVEREFEPLPAPPGFWKTLYRGIFGGGI